MPFFVDCSVHESTTIRLKIRYRITPKDDKQQEKWDGDLPPAAVVRKSPGRMFIPTWLLLDQCFEHDSCSESSIDVYVVKSHTDVLYHLKMRLEDSYTYVRTHFAHHSYSVMSCRICMMYLILLREM